MKAVSESIYARGKQGIFYVRRRISAALRASFGCGADTLVDTAVRRTWQVAVDRVRIQGGHWPAMLDGIVERAAAGLGAGAGVDAELYKLLVYDEGSFSSGIATPRSRPGCSAR